MAARILKSLPNESKYDAMIYFLLVEIKTNNQDGFICLDKLILADSPAEAVECAKKFLAGSKKKRIIDATLHDPRGKRLLFLRGDDIRSLK